MIPVTIVTGFLGSGKTTLIARCLRDPAFGRTAVIVSEFGEVGLDHDLIAASDDKVLTLATGCLCCAVQTDLVRTLLDLWHQRRDQFDRVLIETSGLSDPAPVLQSLIGDADVAARYCVPAVVAVVDAVHGAATLAAHPEALHQAGLADRLLISKTDLLPLSDGLAATLDALNPAAPRSQAATCGGAELFADNAPAALAERLQRTPRAAPHDGIDTFTLLRDRPVPALALTLLLQALAEHCGARLLRLKGLVDLQEMPGRPAVVHGVRHVFSPPEFLDRWPSADRSTRIVLIAKGVPRHFPARLLDAIEAEVREETGESA
jgi:Ni2+-binding GTPase involved in maturation of urease and hydrogenase